MSDIQTTIETIVSENKVVLFMKGDKQMPQCGFSARAVGVLQSIGVEFETVNVLADPAIRQGIKDFSSWPTIPQLYVDREFIGGSDIVSQMFESGELHQLLGVTYTPPTPPSITATDAFVDAIRAAMKDAPGGGLPRLQISPRFEYGFGLSEEAPGDFKVEANGLTLLIDRSTAERANGMTLDFHTGPDGGIAIDNPNEPPTVRRLDVQGYKAMRDNAVPHHLIDVRTAEEWAIARVEGAVLLENEGSQFLDTLDADSVIVLMCHHGMRSMAAASQLLSRGFKKVYNLEGGIDAWSASVDPKVPRY